MIGEVSAPGSIFGGVYSEHVVEVRYKPNPVLLDRRGLRVGELAKSMGYEHWQVVGDQVVKAARSDNKEWAFVGYRNAAITCQDLGSGEEFGQRATTFCRTLYGLPDFGARTVVTRLGVRSRFLKEYQGTFDSLRDLFVEKCVRFTERFRAAIEASVEDVGAPVVGKDKHGTFNMSSGPMKQEQAKGFLVREHDLWPVSLYVDIDYWEAPKNEIDVGQLARMVSIFAEQGWRKYNNMLAVLEGK